jgi:hypothetical protein
MFVVSLVHLFIGEILEALLTIGDFKLETCSRNTVQNIGSTLPVVLAPVVECVMLVLLT